MAAPASLVRSTAAIEGDELESRFVVIAAGAVPMRLGLPGEEHLITSTEFLELDELRNRIAARAGAQVTILEQTDRMLAQFDPDLVGWLVEKTRSLGIEIRLEARVDAIEKIGRGFKVHVRSGRDSQMIQADFVVHAAGRVPDLEPLDLGAAGVEVSGGRLRLNEFPKSVSNPGVYTAGDAAASSPPLTPVASLDPKEARQKGLRPHASRENV